MGGSGGGASGAVSYPTYMTTFHGRILDNNGADSPSNSFIDAFNVAYGNSPYASAIAYNPATDLNAAIAGVGGLGTTYNNLNNLVDFSNAYNTAGPLFPLGVTPLDAVPDIAVQAPTLPAASSVNPTPSPLDTTTLDSVVADPAQIAADIAAMDAILTAQIEQEELPRFRAGMLNINAIHSSAYIIGEALLRADKDRALAKYGTDLQLKIAEQIRDINARLMVSYREITARLQTSSRELTSRDAIATKEINARNLVAMTELQVRLQDSFRENVLRLQLSQRELNTRHLVSKREIDAKFHMHRYEIVKAATVQMLADLMKKMDLSYQQTHLNSETRRLSITAHKEEVEEILAIEESDAKWNLELFRYAGNILAAPSGGVAQGNDKKSRATSAIGGAISGAAAGAMVGGPYGAAIGAVAGVGLSFLQ